MVDPVVEAGVADTLEARLADARKRHADGEYRTIPLTIVELGIRAQWATEYPSRPASPRPVRNEGGINDEDSGAQVSGSDGTKKRGVIKVDGGVDQRQARVQRSMAAAGSSRVEIDGRCCSPLRSGGGLSATTHMTAGGITSAYGYFFKFSPDRITITPLQGRQDLITWRESIEPQLEVVGLKGFADGIVPIPPEDDAELREEFRAARLLTFMMRMAGAEYSTASYTTHVVKGMPRNYNLMKRMMMVSGTRESLDEDSITSYILQDEAMQDAEQPTKLLPQASYTAPTKPNYQQEQRGKPGGGGSGGGQSTKDVDETRLMRGKGRGGGGRQQECWIYHEPDHLSYDCPDRDNSDKDDNKGGRG
ncbi:unnamed protein product [Closterium sp. NIES-53]